MRWRWWKNRADAACIFHILLTYPGLYRAGNYGILSVSGHKACLPEEDRHAVFGEGGGMCFLTIPPSRRSRDTSFALSVLAALGHLSQRERQGTLTRCIRRGYGGGILPRPRVTIPPSRRCRGIRGDAPQGYLFRFASLRGHRPLRRGARGACGSCGQHRQST